MARIPVWLASALLAGVVFLPGLGSVGLFDPWEPHYAEVSRQMLLRADWVHPWWREAGFFSKPPLLLWGGAAGLAIAGEGAVEWGLRLPVALLAVMGVAVSAEVVARLASRRAGWLAAVALSTAPLLALFARQAVPDAPLVALSTAGGLAFAVALLDDRAGPGWARAGWVLLGFATLAKGPVGFALPGAAFLSWFVVTGDWRRLGRLGFVERVGHVPVPVGPLVFLAIAVPWYAVMAAWPVRDDSGWTFLQRFWLYDHLRRLVAGAHVPTPGGGWLAYLGWLAVGTFPWVAALPGGIGEALRTRGQPRDARGGLALLCGLWAAAGYLLVGFTATRYPHYVLPLVPPLLVLAALFVDRLLDQGLRPHAAAGILGIAALAATGGWLARQPRLLTALFTYDPRRPLADRPRRPGPGDRRSRRPRAPRNRRGGASPLGPPRRGQPGRRIAPLGGLDLLGPLAGAGRPLDPARGLRRLETRDAAAGRAAGGLAHELARRDLLRTEPGARGGRPGAHGRDRGPARTALGGDRGGAGPVPRERGRSPQVPEGGRRGARPLSTRGADRPSAPERGASP